MDRFVLPRLDWHDEEGRIYKDALIENFNALETKLNEINALSAFSTAIPDISQLSLDDVTLESDDNKVVNLRSFLTIFNLVNYPIELTFSGTKIKRIAYWNSDYNYIERNNIATNVTDTNKFIVYNFTNNTVSAKSTVASLQEGEKLLGCYIKGRIITLTTPYSARLNLMYLLANMRRDVQSFKTGPGFGDVNFFFTGGQQAGIRHTGSRGNSPQMTFLQLGRVEK